VDYDNSFCHIQCRIFSINDYINSWGCLEEKERASRKKEKVRRRKGEGEGKLLLKYEKLKYDGLKT